MAQIGFDLEIRIEPEAHRITILQAAAEFLGQPFFGQIGDMRRHARHGEARRRRFVGNICSARPYRISHDCLPANFVKRDILRAVAGRGGNCHNLLHPRRMVHRPGQRLHAAHRTTNHRRQRTDAEMIKQPRLRFHHVGDGDHREIHRERLARARIDARRPGAAHAAAQHIGADHEPMFGIDRLARPHQPRPPTGLARNGVGAGQILITCQRVAHQNRVSAIGVQLAIGFIGDGEFGQHTAARQREIPGQRHAAIKAKTFVHCGAGIMAKG